MPFEDGVEDVDEFTNVLTLIDDLSANNSDCHAILGGDFFVVIGYILLC
jgi:hypothetical protein